MASNPNENPLTHLMPFPRSWRDRRNNRKQDLDPGTAPPTNTNMLNDPGDVNDAAGGAAEMAGIAAAKRQQMTTPVLTPPVQGFSSQKIGEDLDRSGGAREVVPSETPVPLSSSPPLFQQPPAPLPQTSPSSPAPATAPQTRTATAAAQSRTATGSPTKSLAQYGVHDNKGAVGWVAPAPSPDRAYPYRQHVGGHRVLAQYGHNTDKWAVKHPGY